MLRCWNRLIETDNSHPTKISIFWCNDYPDNTYYEDVKKISDIINSYIYHAKSIFNIEQIKQSRQKLLHVE